jgi:hypothetical protein
MKEGKILFEVLLGVGIQAREIGADWARLVQAWWDKWVCLGPEELSQSLGRNHFM